MAQPGSVFRRSATGRLSWIPELLTGRNSNSYSHAGVRRIEREYIRIPARLVTKLFIGPFYMVSTEHYFVGTAAGRVGDTRREGSVH